MSPPVNPKIYHLLHHDRLASVLKESCLLSDAIISENEADGTTVGMAKIKHRRMKECQLSCHPGLYVGQCVPFYFCPRSVMLYIFWKNDHPEIEYTGGQEPIIHLVSDLKRVVEWADKRNRRWAFTSVNAGSKFFDDYNDLNQLDQLNWQVIKADHWSGNRDEKQAEFLIEEYFPWELIESIGVYSIEYRKIVNNILIKTKHKPETKVRRSWYY